MDARSSAGKSRDRSTLSFGFNAQTEEYGDMFKFGVIDPRRRSSAPRWRRRIVAGLLINTEAMVADKPQKEVLLAAACPTWAAWAA